MFDRSLKEFWTRGVEIYLDKYERCLYEFRDAGDKATFCKIRGRQKHTMHIAPDTSSCKAEGHFSQIRTWSPADKDAWVKNIKTKFSTMFHRVFTALADEASSEDELLIQLRRETCHCLHNTWSGIRSNKTCLSCLQAVPDHVLPCGHAFCPRCVQEIGKLSLDFECAFDMNECIFCGRFTNRKIQLKPRCAGVRILTLDGGGIRGIVELAILAQIQAKLNPVNVPLRDFFDLVIGTSTGRYPKGKSDVTNQSDTRNQLTLAIQGG
jgi:hypothetical protein